MVDVKSLLMNSAQLLAGWLGLVLSTAALGLFPDFPVFSVVEKKTKHDILRRTYSRVSRHDNAVGMWVVAEFVFFCLLVGIAATLYCCCRRHQRRVHSRSGTWIFYLIVDPTFVTLAGIPLLLMDVVPRLNNMRLCLLAAVDTVLQTTARCGQNESCRVSDSVTEQCQHTIAEVTLPVTSNITLIARHLVNNNQLQSVSQWLGILQAVVMVPVMLRLLRRRYKMPWSCLVHSQLYLAVQAVDLATVVSLAAGADDRSLRLTAEVSVYLASVYLCVCCMALATPPVYVGHRIVRRYLRFLMFSGTFVQDIPFLVVRVWTAAVISDSRGAGPGFSLLYAFLIKSCCMVTGATIALIVSQSPTGREQGLETDGQVRYRGLVRRRSGSLTADGLVQQVPDNDAADDEHFV